MKLHAVTTVDRVVLFFLYYIYYTISVNSQFKFAGSRIMQIMCIGI